MMNDPGVIAIIGLCLFLVLWYGGASLYSRRLGQRLLGWLESGLDVLGGEREVGWLAAGSPASGARINIRQVTPPFRRLEFTLLIANRDVLLWWLGRSRGKRDWLIIKATLRSPRQGEVEITSGRAAQALQEPDDPPWERQAAPHHLTAAFRGAGASRQLAALLPWLERYGAHLHRLSWRKTDPHLQLQVDARALSAVPARTVLVDLVAALHADRPRE